MERGPTTQKIPKDLNGEWKQNAQLIKGCPVGSLEKIRQLVVERVRLEAEIRARQGDTTTKKH